MRPLKNMATMSRGAVLYQTYRHVIFSLDDYEFEADLVVFYRHEFNVILGID